MHKKFIVYNGNIVIGHVDFHAELGRDKSLIKGGGWWNHDKENDIMYLYSKSMDFGQVKREELVNAIQNGLMRPSFQKTKFFHSFCESLREAINDKEGIWITIPEE